MYFGVCEKNPDRRKAPSAKYRWSQSRKTLQAHSNHWPEISSAYRNLEFSTDPECIQTHSNLLLSAYFAYNTSTVSLHRKLGGEMQAKGVIELFVSYLSLSTESVCILSGLLFRFLR